MLYLHCGWGKTGTTTLRAVLARHREDLAKEGIVLAQEWRSLTTSLAERPAEAIAEFTRFLATHREGDVLCANEGFMSGLWEEESKESFFALLAAAEETMPVRCVWTLRRYDELLSSFYTWRLPMGVQVRRLDDPGRESRLAANLFEGLCELDRMAPGRNVYVKYESGGRHNAELLRRFGIGEELVGALDRELAREPRRNVAPTQKTAAALLNAEALAARYALPLREEDLREAFRAGFRFDGDRRFVPFAPEAREKVHEEILALARDKGFEPYVRFFEEARVDPTPETPVGPDVLDEDDVRRLASQVGGSAR